MIAELMESPEVYRVLIHRIRRGLVICTILWYASVAFIVLALMVPGGRPWAVTAFLTSLMCNYGVVHVRIRIATACAVSENPKLIYWAHPTSGRRRVSDVAIDDCILLMLHLRDGSEYEVGLPTVQMRVFINWLRENNPSVRVGAYDDVEIEEGD